MNEKKQLLVPLNNPRRPGAGVRFVGAIVLSPLTVLGFTFGKLYKFCFGWHDNRMAKQNEQRFAHEIRTHLAFLFAEHGAHIIPNVGTPFPPGFDSAYVTVAVGAIRLRFVRSRGDFGVSVASEFPPQHWEDFLLITDHVGEWDVSRRPYTLESFESILRSRLERLGEALSKDHFEATIREATRAHNESLEKYAATLRERGILPKIIEPRT